MPRKPLSPDEIERRENQREKTLLDVHDAAAYLDIAVSTLDVWRSTKRQIVPFIRVGGRIKYRKADLDSWLEANRVAA